MVEINPASDPRPDEDRCGVCGDLFTIDDWSTLRDNDEIGNLKCRAGWVHLRCKGKDITPSTEVDGFVQAREASMQALMNDANWVEAGPTYTQLRLVCRACNLHFIVCTERPESHGLSTMYCPECGQHDARFIMYEATVPGFIFQSVPGEAEINDIKL